VWARLGTVRGGGECERFEVTQQAGGREGDSSKRSESTKQASSQPDLSPRCP
jgi:hypothetical protein